MTDLTTRLISEVTGRAPRTVAEFANDYVDAFR